MKQTTIFSQAAKTNTQSATSQVADKASCKFTSTSEPSLILGRQETIKASSKVWAVQKADDIIHGINLKLSNMFKGFPFEAAGHTWEDSERLYLLGEFSTDSAEHIAIQKDLAFNYTSGYAAKRFGKSKHKSQVRNDFEEFRLQWMFWVVWQKVKGSKAFQQLLRQIPSNVYILENTSTDNGGSAEIWGCRNRELTEARALYINKVKAENSHLSKKALGDLIAIERNRIDSIGTWQGQNNMGKILMICRRCIIEGTEPQIDLELLRSKKIHIFGKLINF